MYMLTRKLKNVKVRLIEFSESKISDRLDDGKVRANELIGLSEEEAIKAIKPEVYARQLDGSGWIVVIKKKKPTAEGE
ncbi:MAG: hypothetical protein ABI477_03535 [Chryseolinea sp.]